MGDKSSHPPLSMFRKLHPDWHIVPEIMILLTVDVKELAFRQEIVVETGLMLK